MNNKTNNPKKVELLSTSSGCPAGYGSGGSERAPDAQDGVNTLADGGGISYGEYLCLDKVLQAQKPISKVHDEHLFIVTHQAYELWFKQVLYELDAVRNCFMDVQGVVDEARMLEVIRRLQRVAMIMKLLVDQVLILETMAPLDFMDFRDYLSSASGFQSFQFRLLENKFGLKSDHRVKYNQSNYRRVYEDKPEQMELLIASEDEPSLSDVVQAWLERTPGLEEDFEDFNFHQKYEETIDNIMKENLQQIQEEKNTTMKTHLMNNYRRKKEQFDSLFDPEIHRALVKRGERRFSQKAFLGALMISMYSEEPRFHIPNQVLMTLMDIDSFMTKWRYNHVMMVQRMLGSSTLGTGGSSGYQYLRSTLSDKYKVFVDLFNVSTFLIPRHLVPALTPKMKKLLRTATHHVDAKQG